jgi:hypothetical protein
MSITSKIRLFRGLRANLPTPPNSFEIGRPYFCTDTGELFIGAGVNVPMSPVLAAGSSGASSDITAVAGEPIGAHLVVAIHSDGKVYKASSDNIADVGKVLGIAITSATSADVNITVRVAGQVDNTGGWFFTPGEQLYLGLSGALVNDPNTGVFEQPLGVASAVGSLALEIGMSIQTA